MSSFILCDLAKPLHVELHPLYDIGSIDSFHVDPSVATKVTVDVLLMDGSFDRLTCIHTRVLEPEGLEHVKLVHTVDSEEMVPGVIIFIAQALRANGFEDLHCRGSERHANYLARLITIPLIQISHLSHSGSLQDSSDLTVKRARGFTPIRVCS